MVCLTFAILMEMDSEDVDWCGLVSNEAGMNENACFLRYCIPMQ
jgi:hypothetical protein